MPFSLKIIEWNIRSAEEPGSSIEKVSDFIRSQNLDIAFLQEVKRDLFVDQAKEIATRTGLLNYYHVYERASERVAILSRFKFYAITHRVPEVVSGSEPRVIIEARISVPGVNRLRIYNTHWAHRPWHTDQRVEAAKLTASLVKNVITEPIIYAGDLNNQPPGYRPIEPGRERDAEAYNYLINAGLVDSVNVAPPGSPQCTWMNPEPEDKRKRIDYVFFRGQFQVQLYDGRCLEPGEPGFGLSDHNPIIVQLFYSGLPEVAFWPSNGN
jgi:endonuclease/exonuclease/phosphatase family metal-dependent hydrolase